MQALYTTAGYDDGNFSQADYDFIMEIYPKVKVPGSCPANTVQTIVTGGFFQGRDLTQEAPKAIEVLSCCPLHVSHRAETSQFQPA